MVIGVGKVALFAVTIIADKLIVAVEVGVTVDGSVQEAVGSLSVGETNTVLIALLKLSLPLVLVCSSELS